MRGPKEIYNNKVVRVVIAFRYTDTYLGGDRGVEFRKYILEYLVNLDKVLVNVELASGTVSSEKS